jgi:hypothetical protein
MNQGSINTQATFEAMPREIGERLAALRVMPTELLGKIPETVWQTLNIDQRAEILRQYGILEKYVKATESQFDSISTQGAGFNPNTQNQLQGTEISLDSLNQHNQPQGPTPTPQVQVPAMTTASAPVVSEIVHQQQVPDLQQIEFSKQVEQQRLIELQNSQMMNSSTEVEIPTVESSAERPLEVNLEAESVQRQIVEPDKSTLAKATVVEEIPTEKIVPKFFGYSVTDDTARNAKELAESGDTREGRVWAAGLIQKLWDAIFN